MRPRERSRSIRAVWSSSSAVTISTTWILTTENTENTERILIVSPCLRALRGGQFLPESQEFAGRQSMGLLTRRQLLGAAALLPVAARAQTRDSKLAGYWPLR